MTRVLVPYDGSAPAEEALRYALTAMGEVDVEVLYVIDPVGKGGDRSTKASWWEMWQEDLEDRADQVLDEADAIAAEHEASISTTLATGKPSKVILEQAREGGFDAVVMGRQGERGMSRALLGSVAERVARHSDLPVTLVGETNP